MENIRKIVPSDRVVRIKCHPAVSRLCCNYANGISIRISENNDNITTVYIFLKFTLYSLIKNSFWKAVSKLISHLKLPDSTILIALVQTSKCNK